MSDAGPLIALGRLDLLSLLEALFAEVQVPEQVLRECAARPGNDDALRIVDALSRGWLTPCRSDPIIDETLGRGERVAIARALKSVRVCWPTTKVHDVTPKRWASL